jgi:hypothetical protein
MAQKRHDSRVHHHIVRTRWGLYPRQRANILRALLGVHERAVNEHRSSWWGEHMSLMVIECGLTEARWHNYGNVASSESYRLADYVPTILRPVWGTKWIGSDHDSVGCFQQRTSWGSFEHRMDPKTACHAFMGSADSKGADQPNQRSVWLDIQEVQVSFDSTGHNYEVNDNMARVIREAYWDKQHNQIRGKRQLEIARHWHFPK